MDIINVQNRDFTVKAKQLRKMGLVPGSIVGKDLPGSVSIQVAETELRKLLSDKREGSKVKIVLGDKSSLAQIKKKNIDPLTNKIIDVTFQQLKSDEKVNSVAHIILKNKEKVTEVLENPLTEVPYAAYPVDMIDTVTVDVDGMAVGTVVTVADIPEFNSDKIELQIEKDQIVLKIVEKNVVVEETEETPAEE